MLSPNHRLARSALNPARLAAALSALLALAVMPALAGDLDSLREKLSQALGASKAPDSKSPYVVRVATKASGEFEVSAKPRSKAHAVPAATKAETGSCAKGQRQSPIDIRGGIAVDLEPVQFDYGASAFGVIDNGHTVQVNLAPGNAIEVLGRRYELEQFHFHRPSEERIEGRQFDMSAHLVHKDVDGRQAVVAVLLESGSAHPLVQAVWNNLPLERGEETPARVLLNPARLLPADRRYYTYMGSLTTAPCNEGVLWVVMQQPVSLSAAQIDIFARLYPMNARPVQALSGRLIKQSN